MTSLLQRTRLNITVACQAWHAKNARHMLLGSSTHHFTPMTLIGDNNRHRRLHSANYAHRWFARFRSIERVSCCSWVDLMKIVRRSHLYIFLCPSILLGSTSHYLIQVSFPWISRKSSMTQPPCGLLVFICHTPPIVFYFYHSAHCSTPISTDITK